MGSGCTCQSNLDGDSSDRIRLHRQGNLSFYIHGKGCKKTPAWQTSLPKEEIELKIKEFWDTRVEGSPLIWNILQLACNEADEEKAEMLIKTYGLNMNNGLLLQTYDERGYRYDLPPFVINEAVKYGLPKPTVKAAAVKKNLKFSLTFRSAGRSDVVLNVSSEDSIEEIKSKYKSAASLSKEIRLFFNGKELTDNTVYGAYSIPDNIVIQVFIKH